MTLVDCKMRVRWARLELLRVHEVNGPYKCMQTLATIGGSVMLLPEMRGDRLTRGFERVPTTATAERTRTPIQVESQRSELAILVIGPERYLLLTSFLHARIDVGHSSR